MLEAQAAPALAEAARNLGMIPSRDTAHLVQDPSGNWVVVGTPKPAQGVSAATAEHAAARGAPPAPPPPPRRASWSRARSPSACRPVLRRHPLRCRRSSLRRQGHRQRRWQFRRVPRSRTPPRDRRPRWARRLCLPHRLPMRRQHPSSRPRKCPLCRLTQVRRRRPRPWPRHFPAPPHEPRRQSGPTARAGRRRARRNPVRSARRGHGGRASLTAENGLRSASFVFRHRAGNAVIFLVLLVAAAQLFNLQVPTRRGPARRGGGSAQGHRRREGRAR